VDLEVLFNFVVVDNLVVDNGTGADNTLYFEVLLVGTANDELPWKTATTISQLATKH
jgi:hypothetical protein